MVDALTSKKMLPEPLKVAARAKREPEGKFHSLAQPSPCSDLAGAPGQSTPGATLQEQNAALGSALRYGRIGADCTSERGAESLPPRT